MKVESVCGVKVVWCEGRCGVTTWLVVTGEVWNAHALSSTSQVDFQVRIRVHILSVCLRTGLE